MSILPYSIISLNEISRYIDNKITPEYLLEKKEIKKEVIDALKKLPQREYEVLELYYYEWLTLKEISNIFRISEIRTYKIYRKAMQDLKDIFIKKEIFK
ncbi:sigma-70 family RNA polymerase sigma factor [Brachyspira aalborgi]|uniref:sigma-70 family RNA polymerase sigma factor n=1 Tax=Brachyspira aalborgi TaxID=29522 RepID=UPI0026656AFA|nr:sigma-70 family RNA polymerase sigma factor [Brachyspira aalborgi]